MWTDLESDVAEMFEGLVTVDRREMWTWSTIVRSGRPRGLLKGAFLKPSARAKVLHCLSSGMPMRQVARIVGVSRSSVRRWAISANLHPGRPPKSDQRSEALRLVAAGVSKSRAAEIIGVHRSTVYVWCAA